MEDRRDLLPLAIAGISADEGKPRVATLFNFILRMILDIRIPPRDSKDDEAFRASLNLSNSDDAKYLAKLIGIFLRVRAPTAAQTLAQANPTFTADELSLFPTDNPDTEKVFKRISELKAKVMTLLASAAFIDEEKFLPALYAAGNFDGRVSSTAEEIIKRNSVSLEDETLVKRLFQAHSTLPAANRTRILGMLTKSAVSTTMSDSIMSVVNLDFMPPDPESGSSSQALLPVSALERSKLHKALFQYISWVAQVGPSRQTFTIGPQLIKHMRDYIESQGWPVSRQTSNDDLELRSRAYETVGLLARSADMPVDDRLELAVWLFRALSEDSANEATVNIDGALSSLTANIPIESASKAPILKSTLLHYMSLADEPPAVRSTRHAVVKWANQCLPFSDIHARWIDILAIAGQLNERSDVVEQGHRGLDPWTYFAHNESGTTLPDWTDMTTTIFDSVIDPLSPVTAQPMNGLPTLPSIDTFRNFQGARFNAFPVALKYCKRLLFLSALKDFSIQPDWMQTLDAQITTDVDVRKRIRAYLRGVDSAHIAFYLKVCLDGASVEDSPIVEDCIRCFVDVASLSPGGVIGYLAASTSRVLPLVKSNNKEIRSLAAKAIGILAPHPIQDASSVSNWLQTLHSFTNGSEKAVGPELNAAEGALLAQSHLISRSVYYLREPPLDFNVPLDYIINDKYPTSLRDTALVGFSQLWSAGLSVPAEDGAESVKVIIGNLSKSAKKPDERAISALGRLGTGLNPSEEPDYTEGGWNQGVIGSILEELFALHEIKRTEVHFTVGDAITAVIARWDSNHVKLTMDVDCRNEDFQGRARSSLINSVLSKLFIDCKATKPSLLKASGIWLFCIVQYCSHLPEVQAKLREAQAAFMRLLSARDELVQETASRGLSLVYERGDADLKSTLVKDLVSAFTGTGTQLKVDEDTELFDAGALPTGEGNSITSYKDIVNLANEVGDQRLVYKFMSLAANAATWSTRSAFGRFGLSNILSDSEVDPKLYPKLFRYRFDPNTNVQRSMDDIWKSLVKDTNATIETHFDAIIQDLLQSILGREWRMREASCAAISDLIHGRPFVQYEKYYREIWVFALKVLDDVKGSVREAALRLCMALSTGLVRQLEDGNHSAAAKAMMKEALPFLLSDKGIESSVQDVQSFATITVMKIAKQGGTSLRPFIADMVPQLLGLLSTIEPEQINYHYQRVSEDSRDQIDKLRSQMVNQSPISEAIDNCLRFVNEDIMVELAPKLEATIKSALGLPTKIGCSRVLTALFTRHTSDIKAVSGRFLNLLEKQSLDKNDEVSQAYARAAAYIMRAVSDSEKQKFCAKLVELYFNAEEESRRQKVADVVVSLAKISPDHFTSQESELLPFVYLGARDIDDYTAKVFKEVWEQHAGSSRTAMRYATEIVSLIGKCFDTAQWSLRHTGAFTVAALVNDAVNASETTGQISEANCKIIWPVLDKALALKTFEGKEKLLVAFPKFTEKSRELWTADAAVAAQMKKIAIREAKRNNDNYRPHAFEALWKFTKVRDDLDMLSEIIDVVLPYLDELKDEDKMDVDSKEDVTTKTAKNGFEAVARGYTRSKTREPTAVISMIVKTLAPYISHPRFASIKREVWYSSVKDLMQDVMSTGSGASSQAGFDSDGVLMAYLHSLDLDKAEAGTLSQRLDRIAAVSAVLKAKTKGVFGHSAQDLTDIEGLIQKAAQDERALDAQKAWKGVVEDLHEARRS